MLLAIASMMLLQVVDAFFISRLGTNQLAAISFALPIVGIATSIALGMGMAISSLASRLVGEGDHQKSARLISDGFLIATTISIILAVIGYQTITPLFSWLGAHQQVLPFIHEYMSIWFFATPLLMLSLICSSICRSIGATSISATISICMTLSNMILDPLLIFGLGPFPELGVKGAAYATLFAVLFSLSIGLYILFFKEKLLLFDCPKITHFVPNFKELGKIGINTIFSNLMTPVAATIMTAIVALQGTNAVAGFGVGARIESVSLIIIFALSSTLPMFIGQNIGAGKPQRAYHALMGALKFSIVFQLVLYCLLFLLAPVIARTFSDNLEVQSVIILYLRILPVTYGFHGVVILTMVSLNVLKKPQVSLLITLVRMLVLYLPLAWLGSKAAGISGMFIGAAIGNILASIFAYNRTKHVLQQQNITA